MNASAIKFTRREMLKTGVAAARKAER